jgi:hypothetical protein
MKKLIATVLLAAATACAVPGPTDKPAEKPVETKPATETPKSDGTPAEVKAAFPDAASITAQMSKTKSGEDFISYVAFTMKDGKKTTLGVATLVQAEGATYVLAVDNNVDVAKVSVAKSGGKAELESPAFLDQFTKKTHDDAFKIGKDLKFAGTDKAGAEKVVKAIYDAELNLQAIYGKPHTH